MGCLTNNQAVAHWHNLNTLLFWQAVADLKWCSIQEGLFRGYHMWDDGSPCQNTSRLSRKHLQEGTSNEGLLHASWLLPRLAQSAFSWLRGSNCADYEGKEWSFCAKRTQIRQSIDSAPVHAIDDHDLTQPPLRPLQITLATLDEWCAVVHRIRIQTASRWFGLNFESQAAFRRTE